MCNIPEQQWSHHQVCQLACFLHAGMHVTPAPQSNYFLAEFEASLSQRTATKLRGQGQGKVSGGLILLIGDPKAYELKALSLLY